MHMCMCMLSSTVDKSYMFQDCPCAPTNSISSTELKSDAANRILNAIRGNLFAANDLPVPK